MQIPSVESSCIFTSGDDIEVVRVDTTFGLTAMVDHFSVEDSSFNQKD